MTRLLTRQGMMLCTVYSSSLCFSPSQRQQRPYISHILQRLQHRNQMKQAVIRWIVDPAFDWNCVICSLVSRPV